MLSLHLRSLGNFARRNFTAWAPAMTKATDPIQSLFVAKIREYDDKKQAAGGKLVDSSKETELALQAELDKVAKQYGGGAGMDMTSFPQLNFADMPLDPINIGA